MHAIHCEYDEILSRIALCRTRPVNMCAVILIPMSVHKHRAVEYSYINKTVFCYSQYLRIHKISNLLIVWCDERKPLTDHSVQYFCS